MIKRYNISDSFALAAGQLTNRARGLGPIRAAWPASDPPADARAAHGAAAAAAGARPHGERLRGTDRFRPAGTRSGSSRQARHAAGRASDGGVAGEDRGAPQPRSVRRRASTGGGRLRRAAIRRDAARGDAHSDEACVCRGSSQDAAAKPWNTFRGTITSPFMIGRAVRSVPATTSMSAPLPVVSAARPPCRTDARSRSVRGLASSALASSCAIVPSSAQAVDTHTAPVTAWAACSACGVR